MLQPDEIARIEDLLVEIHNFSEQHRFDIMKNEEFKVKPTPKDAFPAFSQSLPQPISLKEDILVLLALIHRYGIISTLPFSKYAGPIFAHKQPNGKLWLLVVLRKICDVTSIRIIPSALWQTPSSIWQAKGSYANWVALKHTIVRKWQTKSQSR